VLIVLLFAVLLAYFGARMALAPELWARDVARFGRWRPFHLFEISSRIIAGGLMIWLAPTTHAPVFFNYMGYFLVAVGVGLIGFGEKRHRAFAKNAAERYRHWFRPAGVFAIFASITLVYFSGLFPPL